MYNLQFKSSQFYRCWTVGVIRAPGGLVAGVVSSSRTAWEQHLLSLALIFWCVASRYLYGPMPLSENCDSGY